MKETESTIVSKSGSQDNEQIPDRWKVYLHKTYLTPLLSKHLFSLPLTIEDLDNSYDLTVQNYKKILSQNLSNSSLLSKAFCSVTVLHKEQIKEYVKAAKIYYQKSILEFNYPKVEKCENLDEYMAKCMFLIERKVGGNKWRVSKDIMVEILWNPFKASVKNKYSDILKERLEFLKREKESFTSKLPSERVSNAANLVSSNLNTIKLASISSPSPFTNTSITSNRMIKEISPFTATLSTTLPPFSKNVKPLEQIHLEILLESTNNEIDDNETTFDNVHDAGSNNSTTGKTKVINAGVMYSDHTQDNGVEGEYVGDIETELEIEEDEVIEIVEHDSEDIGEGEEVNEEVEIETKEKVRPLQRQTHHCSQSKPLKKVISFKKVKNNISESSVTRIGVKRKSKTPTSTSNDVLGVKKGRINKSMKMVRGRRGVESGRVGGTKLGSSKGK